MAENSKKTAISPWERFREILGLIIIFLAVFVTISVLQAPFRLSLLGASGDIMTNLLVLLFGRYVSFAVPIVLFYIAISLIQNTLISALWQRMVGVTLAVVSLCALLALVPMNSTTISEEHTLFYAGGIIGNFFVQPDGLRLPLYFGHLGTFLIGVCFLLVSLLLIFDMSLKDSVSTGQEAAIHLVRRIAMPVITRIRKRGETPPTSRTLPGDDRKSSSKAKKHKKPLVVRNIFKIPQNEPESRTKEKKVTIPLGQPDLFSNYKLPPLKLLDEPPKDQAYSMTDEELERLSEIIEQTLKDYGIDARIVAVTQGPVVTRFELQPAPGIKINKILTLERELAMVLRATSVRLQAPIPGKSAVGIEIPNPKVAVVYLKDMLQSHELLEHKSILSFVLGQTISGEPYLCDLTSTPHLLIAGATGSGKSVCINSIITCILFRQPPDRVKFLLIDPKRVELSVYQDIPHLIAPVICEAREAAVALSWLVTLMEDRYKQLVEVGVRNIKSYNRLVMQGKPHPRIPGKNIEYMPTIVVIIDELADLMIVARQAVEENVIRLSQLARAVGIHLVIATQRPSVNVITGIIKANFPARIAFQVSSKVDSRTILDMKGAEVLIGKGDMLFLAGGGHKPIRVQGTFVSDGEVERIVEFVKTQGKPDYFVEKFEVEKKKSPAVSFSQKPETPHEEQDKTLVVTGNTDGNLSSDSNDTDESIDDELYQEAIKIILMTGKASTSYLQRRLKIGYVRAGRLMDMMEADGIVGPSRGSKHREILVEPSDYLSDFERGEDESE